MCGPRTVLHIATEVLRGLVSSWPLRYWSPAAWQVVDSAVQRTKLQAPHGSHLMLAAARLYTKLQGMQQAAQVSMGACSTGVSAALLACCLQKKPAVQRRAPAVRLSASVLQGSMAQHLCVREATQCAKDMAALCRYSRPSG